MQNLTLQHIQHTQLDTTIWCATAQLPPLETIHNKRQWQREGVRLLLQQQLLALNIKDSLDDTQFPYQLNHSRYYTCFSHSADKVAVTTSARRATGIDIETQDINWRVAKRFYHIDEIRLLAKLTIEQQSIVARWLWQIKESVIKVQQYTLAQGLGMNYVAILPALVETIASMDSILYNTTINARNPIVIDDIEIDTNTGFDLDRYYQVALLPYQQTVVVY
ncbi:4'-phosphopantetheinyl transferase superfamily protein [uncultured Psychrobacter sp.]|uniref:4'-phosphopantetheinyl transferase family protein n=1 Tax=uncultured Psychrobacter sp. TaxID=259303 RepID=UPI003458C30E